MPIPQKRSLIFFAALTLLAGTFLTLLYANRNIRRPPPPTAVVIDQSDVDTRCPPPGDEPSGPVIPRPR